MTTETFDYTQTTKILRTESPRFIRQHLTEARIMVLFPMEMSNHAFENWAWKLAAYASATLTQKGA